MSGFFQYFSYGGITGLVRIDSGRKYTTDINYLVGCTVCLVLAESVAIEDSSLSIMFTDFNESITMFSDKIKQIPLCI